MSISEEDRYNEICKDKFKDLGREIGETKDIMRTGFAELKTSLDSFGTTVHDLDKAVRVSNGKPSIISRMDMFERDLAGLAQSSVVVPPPQISSGRFPKDADPIKLPFGISIPVAKGTLYIMDKFIKLVIAVGIVVLVWKVGGVDLHRIAEVNAGSEAASISTGGSE